MKPAQGTSTKRWEMGDGTTGRRDCHVQRTEKEFVELDRGFLCRQDESAVCGHAFVRGFRALLCCVQPVQPVQPVLCWGSQIRCPPMAYLPHSAYFLASVCVSSALQLISRTIRVRPLIHKLVKTLDRGKTKVGGADPGGFRGGDLPCAWMFIF